MATQEERRDIGEIREVVTSIVFHPTLPLVAFSCQASLFNKTLVESTTTIKVWDVVHEEYVATLSQVGAFSHVRFSQDGLFLAAASYVPEEYVKEKFTIDDRITLWMCQDNFTKVKDDGSVLKDKEVHSNGTPYLSAGTFWIHPFRIVDICFVPPQKGSKSVKYLASASDDGNIRLWHFYQDICWLRTMCDASDKVPVQSIGVSEDGRVLMAVDQRGTLTCWSITEDDDPSNPITTYDRFETEAEAVKREMERDSKYDQKGQEKEKDISADKRVRIQNAHARQAKIYRHMQKWKLIKFFVISSAGMYKRMQSRLERIGYGLTIRKEKSLNPWMHAVIFARPQTGLLNVQQGTTVGKSHREPEFSVDVEKLSTLSDFQTWYMRCARTADSTAAVADSDSDQDMMNELSIGQGGGAIQNRAREAQLKAALRNTAGGSAGISVAAAASAEVYDNMSGLIAQLEHGKGKNGLVAAGHVNPAFMEIKVGVATTQDLTTEKYNLALAGECFIGVLDISVDHNQVLLHNRMKDDPTASHFYQGVQSSSQLGEYFWKYNSDFEAESRAASRPRTQREFDVKSTGQVVHRLEPFEPGDDLGTITALSAASSGNYLVTGSTDIEAKAQLVADLEGHVSKHRVTLWSISMGRLARVTLGKHEGMITAVCFPTEHVRQALVDSRILKPTQSMVASGSCDETARLWNWDTRVGLGTLTSELVDEMGAGDASYVMQPVSLEFNRLERKTLRRLLQVQKELKDYQKQHPNQKIRIKQHRAKAKRRIEGYDNDNDQDKDQKYVHHDKDTDLLKTPGPEADPLFDLNNEQDKNRIEDLSSSLERINASLYSEEQLMKGIDVHAKPKQKSSGWCGYR